MLKSKLSYRLVGLFLLAVFFGFSEFSTAKENADTPFSHPDESTQQFAISHTPLSWYAITTDNPNSFTTHPEYSGGGTAFIGFKPGLKNQKQSLSFSHPSFTITDQRILIFQYLYPFHFFF